MTTMMMMMMMMMMTMTTTMTTTTTTTMMMILAVLAVKITIFCNVTPCNLVNVYQHVLCLVNFPGMSVNINLQFNGCVFIYFEFT
jgi:hypothetical protein